MLSSSTYTSYLYKIDLLHNQTKTNKTKFNLVKIAFNYVNFIKYLHFYYSRELVSENAIHLNVFLLLFILFQNNIKIVEKTSAHTKNKFSNVFLKVNLFNNTKINRFVFEFLLNNDFLEFFKKKKFFLKLKFPILYNRTLKFLNIKKNNKLYIRCNCN